jgi:hypothetical protein
MQRMAENSYIYSQGYIQQINNQRKVHVQHIPIFNLV